MKEKLVKATVNERKEADAMRVRLAELEKKQSALIQKNLDGVISDMVLKQQLEYIDREIAELQGSLLNVAENEQDRHIAPNISFSFSFHLMLPTSSKVSQ